MGEDKGHRFLEREQALLVFHDQVIGFSVALGLASLAVLHDHHTFAGAPLGKVGGLDVVCAEVAPLRITRLHLFEGARKEHPNDAILRSIVGHLVNEEQREYLDAAISEAALFPQMLLDGVADLGLKDSLAIRAHFLAHREFHPVGKVYAAKPRIDLLDLEPGIFAPVRLVLQ